MASLKILFQVVYKTVFVSVYKKNYIILLVILNKNKINCENPDIIQNLLNKRVLGLCKRVKAYSVQFIQLLHASGNFTHNI